MNVSAGAKLTFGGTDENCGMLHLFSAGKLGPDKNNAYSKTLAEHLEKHLKIPSDRYNDILVLCAYNNLCLVL